jgi:hypothetical protein
MHISKIHYEIKFPTMQFGNEVLFVEYTLNEGDNAEDAMKSAREFVWANHKQNNPHLYQDQEIKVTDLANAVVENPKKKQTQEEKYEWLIQQSETLKELMTYQKLAENTKYPTLLESFNSKLKQFDGKDKL